MLGSMWGKSEIQPTISGHAWLGPSFGCFRRRAYKHYQVARQKDGEMQTYYPIVLRGGLQARGRLYGRRLVKRNAGGRRSKSGTPRRISHSSGKRQQQAWLGEACQARPLSAFMDQGSRQTAHRLKQQCGQSLWIRPLARQHRPAHRATATAAASRPEVEHLRHLHPSAHLVLLRPGRRLIPHKKALIVEP